jgi:ribose transport system ATP-binding protein
MSSEDEANMAATLTSSLAAATTAGAAAAPIGSGSSDAVIVEHVSKAFGETQALSDCSFCARAGEIHAIVGENGSGKSTLAKILSGVIMPDHGDVRIFGQWPKSPVEARKLGIATIFQEVLVADDASVLDNLYVGSHGFGFSSKGGARKRETAGELLRRLTLSDIDLDARVGDLPLNIKQWIVISRALLTNPKILILDESSAALDLDATNRLHEEMRRLRNAGASVIIVTHRIAELIKITDRATILRDGHVAGELARDEINEQNLLTLMTPPSRMQRMAARGAAESSRRRSGEVVLDAKGVQAQIGASVFDFELRKREIVGIAGLDGQGQDNFVRRIAGIGFALNGEIEIRSADSRRAIQSLQDADELGVCYVSGDRKREGIFPNLNIFENLAMALYRRNSGWLGWLNKGPVRAAFAAEVKRFSIKTGSSSNRITSLSGGNQQKVLIGRAFARSPSIIVLNDPARGVDLGTKVELYDELRRYAANGGAVVYLSSEIEEFLGFADRVAVFHKGTIFRVLSGEDVTEDKMLAAMFGHTAPVHFDTSDAGRS